MRLVRWLGEKTLVWWPEFDSQNLLRSERRKWFMKLSSDFHTCATGHTYMHTCTHACVCIYAYANNCKVKSSIKKERERKLSLCEQGGSSTAWQQRLATWDQLAQGWPTLLPGLQAPLLSSPSVQPGFSPTSSPEEFRPTQPPLRVGTSFHPFLIWPEATHFLLCHFRI